MHRLSVVHTRIESDTRHRMVCSMNKYYVTRGKLVSRVAKYPGLQDYLVLSIE